MIFLLLKLILFNFREKTCCGIIFKGPCGEVLLDRRYLNPCFCRSSSASSPASLSPTQSEPEPIPPSSTEPSSKCFDENINNVNSTLHVSPSSNIDTMRMLAATATSLKSSNSTASEKKGSSRIDPFMNGYSRLPTNCTVD